MTELPGHGALPASATGFNRSTRSRASIQASGSQDPAARFQSMDELSAAFAAVPAGTEVLR